MARGTTLGELRSMLRAEARMHASPAATQSVHAAMNQTLQRVQRRLYADYDWPFLRKDFDKTLSAGQRYYDFPDGLNVERIERVAVLWGSTWHVVERGIDPVQHYNQLNSDDDQRSDPVMRWEPRVDNQFEVWPLPASEQTLRFTGIRALGALIADDDVADLDDDLIVLYAAAEWAPDGLKEQKLAEAVAHYRRLKARLRGGSDVMVLGGGLADEKPAIRELRVAYVR